MVETIAVGANRVANGTSGSATGRHARGNRGGAGHNGFMAHFDSVNPARPSEVLGTSSRPPTKTSTAPSPPRVRHSVSGPRRPIPARADLIARAAEVIAERKGELAALGGPRGRQGPRRGRRRRAGGHRHGPVRRRSGPRGAGWRRAVRARRQDGLDDAAADRRRRDDHSVELPGRHPVVEVLSRVARWQRDRAQAVRARADCVPTRSSMRW